MADDRLTLTATAPFGGGLTVDLVAVAWLAEAALDHIWYAGQADGWEGCCPLCCASCAALKRLLDDGQLDALLAHAPAAVCSAWWHVDHLGVGGVDREWLANAWRLTCCHAVDSVDGDAPYGPLSAPLTAETAPGVAQHVPDPDGGSQAISGGDRP